MEKRVIAVDCDDVVVETAPEIVRHYNQTYGAELQLKDFYSVDLDVWKAPDQDTAIRRVREFLNTDEHFSLEPTRDAIETIHKLKKVHDLHMVTGRPDIIEAATLDWLERHFPDIFRTVVFTNFFNLSDGERLAKPKNEVCIELGADYLVDDHLHHAEITAPSVEEVFLFGNYPWNQTDLTLADNIRRVSGWQEIGAILLDDVCHEQAG